MADPSPPFNEASTCSPLEQEVLDEYALLVDNLDKVCTKPFYSCSCDGELTTLILAALDRPVIHG